MATIDPHTRIERLVASAEPRFRAEFLALVDLIQDERTLAELTTLLQAGRVEEALASVERAARRLGVAWTESFVASADSTAGVLRRATGEVAISFDRINVPAVQAMQENQLRLVREFSQQQRRATRAALLDGIERGLNPRQQARAFRASIGLTERQVGSVNNFRRLLESRDRQALTRALRDKRFDRTVLAAIENDRQLTSRQINTMVERYRQRFVRHRSEVIARTEALRSVHEGKDAMFRQAIGEGSLGQDQLIQEWNTARDARVRDTHGPMHGQTRPFGVPFVSGGGASLRFPADPSAPAAESIQCRCAVGTRILTPEETGTVTATLIQV